MGNDRLKGLLAGCAAVAVAAFSSAAAAQATEGSDPATAEAAAATAQDQPDEGMQAQSEGIQDIVVTARKREENLQDTPISIAALSAEDLEQRNVNRVSDIAATVPNLTFDAISPTAGSTSAAVVFIRGIGQSDFAGTVDPGVGIYIDGVYLGRTVGSVIDAVDIERVEVLRGPQGTLFGRNTIGGAISIVSKDPSRKFEGRVQAEYGTDDYASARVILNTPITEGLQARLTASIRRQDGYVKRVEVGDDPLGETDSRVARLSLRAEPADTVTITVVGDYARNRDSAAPFVLTAVNENGLFPSFNNFLVASPPCAPNALNDPRCYNEQFISGRGVSRGTAPQFSNTDAWGISGTVDIDIGADVTLKSITAYRELDSRFARDGDHSPLRIIETNEILDGSQFSQELQLAGSSFGDRFNWIIGAYYFDEEYLNTTQVGLAPVEIQVGGNIDNTSYALFTQGTFDITEALSLTLGGRYTEDTKRFDPDAFIKVPGQPLLLPRGERSLSYSQFTPAINLAYKPTEDLMAYASYSKGYKAGGFTRNIFPSLPEAPTFDPEKVDVYELGAKLDAFDRRLRLNGAVFRTEYKELQLTVLDGVAPIVRNAARARIQGLELEATLVPVDNLRIGFGAGYLDAKYTEVSATVIGITTDNELPKVSDWSLTANISYELDLGGMGTLTPYVDWSYRSGFFHDAVNAPEAFQPGYHLVNARVAFEADNRRWGAALSVTNLFDKSYTSAIYSDMAAAGFTEAAFNRGREVRGSVHLRF